MFKHLKRNLKLGLTTLAILTAGGFAGTAFAQTYANDRVGYCAKYPNSSLCPRQVDNCVNYPFGTSTYSYGSGGCAGTFTAQELIVARVRYCGKSTNSSKSVCRTTVARPNAANWANQNPRAGSSARTDTRGGYSKFVKGTATGLDVTGVPRHGSITNTYGALNLNTATFNGRALGGDATDGVAFFVSGQSGSRFHAGIFSGTDLGAPVTQRSGTARWGGQFQAIWFDTNQDFVLEVTFGNADQNKAGSIEAFIHRKSTDRHYGSASHFYLKGDFDNSGLITGTTDAGNFTNNDRNRPTVAGHRATGVLTGLIGQEGAVGVFRSDIRYAGFYSGGFVARPASISTALIADCIIGNNANASRCSAAISQVSCIKNPFASSCETNSNFRNFYVQARANRITFCDNPSNANNNLCRTSTVKRQICSYDPFNAVCFDNNNFSAHRVNKIIFCQSHSGLNDPSCKGTFSRPNTATLLRAFGNGTPVTPSTYNRRNEFLKDTGLGLSSGTLAIRSVRPLTTLTLADSLSDGLSLGGDVADGVAFFGSKYGSQYLYYAGILVGTDLGTPLIRTNIATYWNGKIKAHNITINKDFQLKITFNSGRTHVGQVEAFVQRTGSNYYHIKGNFDNNGVITGTVDLGDFTDGDSRRRAGHTSDRLPGTLRGLIGQQGAVGAFIANNNGDQGYYSGGFVASPDVQRYVRYAKYIDRFGTQPTVPTIHGSTPNQFLAGTASGIPLNNVIRGFGYRENIPPPINKLNFGNTNFAGKNGRGDSNDGVYFASGWICQDGNCYAHTAHNHYVGINPNIDLGPLIERINGTADWPGKFHAIHGLAGRTLRDFTLQVNFGNRSISTFQQRTGGNHFYKINGTYDHNGVISGNVVRGVFNNGVPQGTMYRGTLRGLIGQDGAVGAFLSYSYSNFQDYSGGFIANPPR